MGNNKFTTIKIWRSTLDALRVVAALRGQAMAAVLDELVQQLYDKEVKKWRRQ